MDYITKLKKDGEIYESRTGEWADACDGEQRKVREMSDERVIRENKNDQNKI